MGQDMGIFGSLGTWCLESESFLSGVSPSPLGASREDSSNTQERREKGPFLNTLRSLVHGLDFYRSQEEGTVTVDTRWQKQALLSLAAYLRRKEKR